MKKKISATISIINENIRAYQFKGKEIISGKCSSCGASSRFDYYPSNRNITHACPNESCNGQITARIKRWVPL